MGKSIIMDAVNKAYKVANEYDVSLSCKTLDDTRETLVKTTALGVLLLMARSRYATSLALSGIAISGTEYINHRFGITRKVGAAAKDAVRIVEGVVKHARG